MKALNAAPEMSGKRIVFKRLVQDGAAPARFTVTLQDDRSLTDTVKRFVENTLRRSGGLEGVPVKIVFQVMPKKR